MRGQPKTPLSEFLEKSRSRYLRLCVRGPVVPFTLAEFRHWLTLKLSDDATARCEYCNAIVNIHTLQIDHRMPLVQGGEHDFDNLAISCECCNQQKGAMSADAFIQLLRFVSPASGIFSELDRTDLLGRLQSQLKLALAAQKRLAGASKQPSKAIRVVPHVQQPRKAM